MTDNSYADGTRNVTLTNTASSDDDVFDGVTATVTVAITDDDATMLEIATTPASTPVTSPAIELNEEHPNGITAYTVVLKAEPESNVTVTIEGVSLRTEEIYPLVASTKSLEFTLRTGVFRRQ